MSALNEDTRLHERPVFTPDRSFHFPLDRRLDKRKMR